MARVSRRALLLGAGASIATVYGIDRGFPQEQLSQDQSEGAERDGEQNDRQDGGADDQKVPLANEPLLMEYSLEELRSEVLSGGPPKDGIPSIDDPKFIRVEAADERLRPDDIVFGVVRGNDVKSYPQYVLVHHEIANDTLDGTPVSITYCPLTGTAMGFERGETTFGVSGNLLNNNLVMYDRETDSRWPQVLATAIEGTHEGESLREFRLVWTTWERWKQQHPETEVLSEDTGYIRDYGQDPYGSYNPRTGYYTSSNTLFERLQNDDRYPPKRVVVGARTPENAIAFEKDALRESGVLEGTLGNTPVVAVYGSQLDTAYVYRNPDETPVEYEDGTVTVGGTTRAAENLPLDRVYAFDAMWFAWVGMYPNTRVVDGGTDG